MAEKDGSDPEGETSDVSSSEETDAIVNVYDEMFSDRYSSTDEPYQDVLQSSKPPPPCVKNWFPKQNRNFDRSRGGGGGRGYHRGNYNRNYDNQWRGSYDNRHYQGHRDQGQGYRDQGQGYRDQGQGYRSHDNQRNDRRYQPY